MEITFSCNRLKTTLHSADAPYNLRNPQKPVPQVYYNAFPSNVALSDLCYQLNKLNKTIISSCMVFVRFQNLFPFPQKNHQA